MLAAIHNHLITMLSDYYLMYSGDTYCDQFIVLLTSLFHKVFYKAIMTYMYYSTKHFHKQIEDLSLCCLFVCLAVFQLVFSICSLILHWQIKLACSKFLFLADAFQFFWLTADWLMILSSKK